MATIGCQGPPGNVGDPVEAETEMRGFSWVVDNELAAMPKPGARSELALDLDFIAGQDIHTMVSLTITPIEARQLASRGIVGHHIPVQDFTAPTLEQMTEFVELVAEHGERGERVGVHCTAGLGRSGTMAAANFVYLGLNPDEAIREIRRLRPGSIETASQEASIAEFAATLTD